MSLSGCMCVCPRFTRTRCCLKRHSLRGPNPGRAINIDSDNINTIYRCIDSGFQSNFLRDFFLSFLSMQKKTPGPQKKNPFWGGGEKPFAFNKGGGGFRKNLFLPFGKGRGFSPRIFPFYSGFWGDKTIFRGTLKNFFYLLLFVFRFLRFFLIPI